MEIPGQYCCGYDILGDAITGNPAIINKGCSNLTVGEDCSTTQQIHASKRHDRIPNILVGLWKPQKGRFSLSGSSPLSVGMGADEAVCSTVSVGL